MALDGNQVSITMPPIIRGATWRKVFKLTTNGTTPINISAWIGANKGVRCQLRKDSTTTTVTATPTCTILDSGTTGRVEMLLTAAVTTGIPADASTLYGDPEFYDASSPTEEVNKPVKITVATVEEFTK